MHRNSVHFFFAKLSKEHHWKCIHTYVCTYVRRMDDIRYCMMFGTLIFYYNFSWNIIDSLNMRETDEYRLCTVIRYIFLRNSGCNAMESTFVHTNIIESLNMREMDEFRFCTVIRYFFFLRKSRCNTMENTFVHTNFRFKKSYLKSFR